MEIKVRESHEAEVDDRFYTSHLGETGKQNKVIATEDIRSEEGVLLVKKGALINERTAVNLVKHKLKKSVSLCVSLEDMVDEAKIHQAMAKFFHDCPEIELLNEKLDLGKAIEKACVYLNRYALLRQKLTVMAANLPTLFTKAIAGAWFSIAIANSLKYDSEQLDQIFLAALVRDVGMMHIDPELISTAVDDVESARRMIKGHVLISKIVLDEVAELPLFIKRAIFEHHERCDGAGYPKGKMDTELSQAGQILAMSDTVQELLFRFRSRGHNLANLEGFLTLNTLTYGEDVYKALVRMVKLSEIKPNRMIADADFPSFLEELLSTNDAFLKVCVLLNEVQLAVSSTVRQQQFKVLQNFIARIADMRIKSGVPSEEYGRWIRFVQSNSIKESFLEMEMLDMMFHELAWQIDQVLILIKTLLQSTQIDAGLKTLLLQATSRIDEALIVAKFKEIRG